MPLNWFSNSWLSRFNTHIRCISSSNITVTWFPVDSYEKSTSNYIFSTENYSVIQIDLRKKKNRWKYLKDCTFLDIINVVNII